jgi:hypothetical protein
MRRMLRFGLLTFIAAGLVSLMLGNLVYAEEVKRAPGHPAQSYQQPALIQSIGAGDYRNLVYAPPVLGTIECFDMYDNPTYNGGYRFIPPDPICAVGPGHVVNIGNCLIQWHTKDGTTEVTQSLNSFFSSIGPPLGTSCFDPKVIFDQYEGRFVVVALERNDVGRGDPANDSYILVAVSKTSDPNDGWWYHAEHSSLWYGGLVSGQYLWADYPGFAVDDKAVYITNNMFPYSTGTSAYTQRLWIIDKNPFYSGGTASVTVHDPWTASGMAGYEGTAQPTHMFGTPPIGTGNGTPMGTWLVTYSGYTSGDPGGVEWLLIIECEDPLGSYLGPYFTAQWVNFGDWENLGGTTGWPDLPDAPQLGGSMGIEVNDRRCLHSVWRDNNLVTCTTINPNSGPDIGQTTAHWFQIDTSNPYSLSIIDQGNVGAEDLGLYTFTFFPSVAIDHCLNIGIGFAASNENIYGGAYYTGRLATDPPGTVQPTSTLALGLDYYERTFGGSRNRWGDYSGISVCPLDQATFWVYNEYAIMRGYPTSGLPTDDGNWGTRLGDWRFDCPAAPVFALTCPRDTLLGSEVTIPLYVYAGFSITNLGTFPMTFDYLVSTAGPATLSDCGNPAAITGTTPLVAPGASFFPPNACLDLVPLSIPATQTTTYYAWPTADPSMIDSCKTQIVFEPPVAVAFEMFEARPHVDGIELEWSVSSITEVFEFNIYRSEDAGKTFDLIEWGLSPNAMQNIYIDEAALPGKEYIYRIGVVSPEGEDFSIELTASAAPAVTRLEQNWPNPFNPVTRITFSVPADQPARLSIYDVNGKLVRKLFEGTATRGENTFTWDGKNDRGQNVSSGVYYYKLYAGKFSDTKKMVMLR